MDEPAFLFSYGSLRAAAAQRAVFGHAIEGFADSLIGFVAEPIRLSDTRTISTSGTADHRILRPTEDGSGEVAGLALAVGPDDIAAADAYEPAGYVRTIVTLASGRRAYVYVAAGAA